jgi:hypothetical protein
LSADCAIREPIEKTATVAQAESTDTFGVGSGRGGDFMVAGAGAVLNSYAPIAAVSADATIVSIGTVRGGPTFGAGDLVLVWRTTGLATAVSGSQTAIALAGDVGTYELGRVKSAAAGALTLTNALGSATRYAVDSQIVRVPEYKTLTVGAGASVAAYPWDGSSGGIIAVFATVAVANTGGIGADGAGFRGGGIENANIQTGCASLDDWSNAMPVGTCGGAHKGEGLFPGAYATANPAAAGTGPATTYGRGNSTNGGGGGDAHNAGGGGGGNAGTGGVGGRTWINDVNPAPPPAGPRFVGGLGGAALTYSTADHLALGGGGGAGEENNQVGSAGGNGGGVVLLRTASLTGTGAVTANGASVTVTAGNDGSGGGGAGGLVVIESEGTATCAAATANGGQGGSGGTDPDGPGGGGSGGFVVVQSSAGTCAPAASAGASGTTTTTMAPYANTAYGAGPGGAGVVTASTGIGYSGAVCTPAVLGANHCGGCVLASDCPGAQPVCDSSTNTCVPCNGNFGSTASHACATAALGVCVTSGANAGTCVACATSADCSNPTPVCGATNACVACNGDNGSTASSPCPTTATPFCNTTAGSCGAVCVTDGECGIGQWCDDVADAGACQPKVANGQPVPGGTCAPAVAARACVSTACVGSGTLAGTCEACATDANCSAPTPVCDTTTATCVQCTPAEAAACSGPTPVCDPTKLSCAACNGDNGSTASLPCPATVDPFCTTTGACGKCTSSGDCATGHAGSICSTATGACGGACTVDADCPATDWCASGVCTPKTMNGSPLPAASPIGGTCTVPNGTRVCASGVCDKDGECGYANGSGPCSSGDAGTSDAGSGAVVCRSGHCATTGTSANECVQCLADSDCSGPTPVCDPAVHTCVGAPLDAGPDDAADSGTVLGDAGEDAYESAGDDAAASAPDATTTQPSGVVGGTIEGGGLSCSMSTTTKRPRLAPAFALLAFVATLARSTRRRRRRHVA